MTDIQMDAEYVVGLFMELRALENTLQNLEASFLAERQRVSDLIKDKTELEIDVEELRKDFHKSREERDHFMNKTFEKNAEVSRLQGELARATERAEHLKGLLEVNVEQLRVMEESRNHWREKALERQES